MHATIGDHILVRGRKVGDGERRGEVIGIRHDDGSPPYVVRWDDDGHEGLFVPGPGTALDLDRPRRAPRRSATGR